MFDKLYCLYTTTQKESGRYEDCHPHYRGCSLKVLFVDPGIYMIPVLIILMSVPVKEDWKIIHDSWMHMK